MSAKGMYVANRDFTVNTTLGHTLIFKKDVPLYAPHAVRPMLLTYGILPVEGVELPEEEKLEQPAPVPQGADRETQIAEAIRGFVSRNDPNDFTGGGMPRKDKLEKHLGFEITVLERNNAWMASKRG